MTVFVRFRTEVLPRLASANLSIGTASAFVAATAALGLAVDRPSVVPAKVGASWILRGAVGPVDQPSVVAPLHAATQKVPDLT